MNQSPQMLEIPSKRHQKMEFDGGEKIKPPFIEVPSTFFGHLKLR